jgi:hypothetical protein
MPLLRFQLLRPDADDSPNAIRIEYIRAESWIVEVGKVDLVAAFVLATILFVRHFINVIVPESTNNAGHTTSFVILFQGSAVQPRSGYPGTEVGHFDDARRANPARPRN